MEQTGRFFRFMITVDVHHTTFAVDASRRARCPGGTPGIGCFVARVRRAAQATPRRCRGGNTGQPDRDRESGDLHRDRTPASRRRTTARATASVLAPSIPVAGALAVVRVVAVSSARTRGGSIQTAQPAAATSSGIPAAVQSNGMPWDDAVRWRSSGTRADGGAGPCRTRLGLQRSSRARSPAAFAIRRPAADRSRGPRAVGGRRG